MKEVFQDVGKKLLSYFLFAAVLVFIFLCTSTGEFPPRWKSIKAKYESFVEAKEMYTNLMKGVSERMKNANNPEAQNAQMAMAEKQAEQAQLAANHLQKMAEGSDKVQQSLNEIRMDQSRLYTQLLNLVEQNKLILIKLDAANAKR